MVWPANDVHAAVSPVPDHRPALPPSVSSDPAQAERVQRLLAANQNFYDAFERLDLALMEQVWAQDIAATCMHPSPGWRLLRGWEEVRASWAQIFSRLRLIRFTLSDLRVIVSGDLAWITLTERLRAYNDESDEEIREATVATNLFAWSPTGWRLLHHQATMLQEDEVEAPSDPLDDIPLPQDRHDTLRHQRSPRAPSNS